MDNLSRSFYEFPEPPVLARWWISHHVPGASRSGGVCVPWWPWPGACAQVSAAHNGSTKAMRNFQPRSVGVLGGQLQHSRAGAVVQLGVILLRFALHLHLLSCLAPP